MIDMLKDVIKNKEQKTFQFSYIEKFLTVVPIFDNEKFLYFQVYTGIWHNRTDWLCHKRFLGDWNIQEVAEELEELKQLNLSEELEFYS